MKTIPYIVLTLLFASSVPLSAAGNTGASSKAAATQRVAGLVMPDQAETPRMKAWINYRYGLFIHFGMNTFLGGTGLVSEPPPAKTYAPPALDVDSWVKLARDAGMKYAVLTTKHNGGFCLWDSKVMWHGKEFDYDVAASGNTTDVVQAFMDACKKYGIAPGLYYNLRDTHATPEQGRKSRGKTQLPQDYFNLVKAQLTELTTRYPECHYFWIDHAKAAAADQLAELYGLLRRKHPANAVLMNQHLAAGAETGDQTLVEQARRAYPVDILNTESTRRPAGVVSKTQRWHGQTLFMGYEHCDMAGHKWFDSGDNPKSVDALFKVYQKTRQDGGNLLLDVGPTCEGVIRPAFRETLLQLKERIDAYEKSAEATPK